MSKSVVAWIAITALASLIASLDGGHLAQWTALAPSRVWHGELWRLATWPLIERTLYSTTLSCLILARYAGPLAARWGGVALARFVAPIVVLAAIATCLVALVSHHANEPRLGGWAITAILMIAWGRQFPDWTLVPTGGLFRLRGASLVLGIVGLTIVLALLVGPLSCVPELAACAIAIWWPLPRQSSESRSESAPL
ncbi:MAG TPA: hypothetical protein VGG74_03620 [Kofleriaceae bacterium]|jgi:hypothetical protein